ncbi:MAG: alkaline phosphatase [Muribaculum sp.]|nr:alkaline phosphatase [Muribaculaceae bacterium]MCM1080619.1 alkaline phosphatase [Muribaculum sp.]
MAISSMAHGQAKYVFYFIGDGMGLGHVAATEYYNKVIAGNGTPLLMTTFPVATFSYTYSLSSPITDSAAAGTALATGNKTLNGHVGLSADSLENYISIATKLKDAGWGVGVLTSVSIDDATPSAFYAHQPSRKMYKEITTDATKSGFNYLAGSGFHSGGKGYYSDDVKKQFEAAGYGFFQNGDSALNSDKKNVVLVAKYPDYHIGHAIDTLKNLSLAEMTQIGIERLKKQSPDKFFMMIEGGNIDYAGHATDGSTIIKEIINFQDAIKMAYDFYLQHPDETLIIITADHDTSGFTLGHRRGTTKYIDAQKISKYKFGVYSQQLHNSGTYPTWEEMKKQLSEKLGFWSIIPLKEKDTLLLEESYAQVFKMKNSQEKKGLYQTFDKFAATVFDMFAKYAGYGYISDYHIGSPVPVYAIGAGSEQFKKVLDNTDIPKLIYKSTQK